MKIFSDSFTPAPFRLRRPKEKLLKKFLLGNPLQNFSLAQFRAALAELRSPMMFKIVKAEHRNAGKIFSHNGKQFRCSSGIVIVKRLGGILNPHFSSLWVEIGKRDETQDASSENEGAYCFVCDRVRVDDATPWIALFTISRIFHRKNPASNRQTHSM